MLTPNLMRSFICRATPLFPLAVPYHYLLKPEKLPPLGSAIARF